MLMNKKCNNCRKYIFKNICHNNNGDINVYINNQNSDFILVNNSSGQVNGQTADKRTTNK